MYDIKKVKNSQGTRVQGAIVPLENIRQSCMLFPRFPGPDQNNEWKDWTHDNVLDLCSRFLVNNWSSKYNYQTIW